MPIVSSVIASDSPQADGRRYVQEMHTDNLGAEHSVLYLTPDAAWDAGAALLARVPVIDAQLTAAEVAANVAQGMTAGAGAALTFNDSTVQQNLQALAGAFPSVTAEEMGLMIAYLLSLPPATVAGVFGMTAAQLALIEQNNGAFVAALEALASSLGAAIATAPG